MTDVTQHRGVVTARRGMAASSQPLATAAGLQALQQGGSAADAALAISAVLCVTEPHASHLGGDAFILAYDHSTNQTTAYNGSGVCPEAITPELFSTGIPVRGPAAASVPGLVDSWFALHKEHGRLPVSELLKPAIYYASEGYPLSYRTARVLAGSSPLRSEFPNTFHTLSGGKEPIPGQLIRQPDLALSLSLIADNGSDIFYDGRLAENIAEYCKKNGGYISRKDLAAHATQVTEPIKITYRGYNVYGQPPVSQGHILLQELNLLEGFSLTEMGHNSSDTIHLMVEAKKLAFADRAAYLGDPKFVDVPISTLLSKEYAKQRRTEISLKSSMQRPSPGEMTHDTTYFCTADSEGNVISFIQSVFWVYGSAAIVDGTGILLNNRMSGFSLNPASPNYIQPGKKPAHTLNAWLITTTEANAEKAAFAGGTPGADIQVQTNLQIISNLIDYGMNPQQAIEAPRWQHGPSTGGGNEEEALELEDRIDESVIKILAEKGHLVRSIGPWAHGSACQVIAVCPVTGSYFGGSDPRCDGHAAGF